MVLSKVHILQTEINPELILDPEGIITIKGRYLVLNPADVPVQIVNWIDAYLGNPAESTEVIIALEYLNSYGTKNLMSILKQLSKVVQQNKKIFIRWYYEEDDEDMVDRAEYTSSVLNVPVVSLLINNLRDL
jgi:hypothetical protein